MNNRQLLEELKRKIDNSFNCKDMLYNLLPLLERNINQGYPGTAYDFINELLKNLNEN